MKSFDIIPGTESSSETNHRLKRGTWKTPNNNILKCKENEQAYRGQCRPMAKF